MTAFPPAERRHEPSLEARLRPSLAADALGREWTEPVFGLAAGNPPGDGLDFCGDVYADLTTELRFELDHETGRFFFKGG